MKLTDDTWCRAMLASGTVQQFPAVRGRLTFWGRLFVAGLVGLIVGLPWLVWLGA